MKKIILIFLLLFPCVILAESELPEHGFYERYSFPDLKVFGTYFGNKRYYFAYEYTYENGLYTLVNPTLKYGEEIDNTLPLKPQYTCESETEISCAQLHAVYPSAKDYAHVGYPAFILENGATIEDYLYYMTSDSYTKEGNLYILKNPEQYVTPDTIRIRNEVEKKYFCKNRTDRCEELFYIDMRDERGLFVTGSNDDYVYGNYFVYEDGKYTIKDIVPSKWPNYNEYVNTYTCMNKNTTCETLYKIDEYINPIYYFGNATVDVFSPSHFNGTKVDNKVKEVEMVLGEILDVENYLKDSTDYWIEDTSIIKVDNNKITPLKIGSTVLLIKKDTEVIQINVKVNSLPNPVTKVGTYIIIPIFILIISGISFIISKEKITM